MFPPESTNVRTKFAQYHAFEDQEKRLEIAKKFIEAKFKKSQAVIDYLKLRIFTESISIILSTVKYIHEYI